MILFQLKRMTLMGLRSLWLHALRSGLTALGIIIGVCAVITMLAIGEGGSQAAQQELKQLGSTNIIVSSVKPPSDSTMDTTQQARVAMYGLTYQDLERIATTIPSVRISVPARRIKKDIVYLGRKVSGNVIGTVPWMPEITNRDVEAGRFLASTDMNYSNNVCVLETGVADVLFPMGDALGQSVRVENDYYQVVGIVRPRPVQGEAALPSMYIPITTARSRFGEILVSVDAGSMQMEDVEIHEATISVDSVDDVIATAGIIRGTLEQFHNKKDYFVKVPLEQLEAAKRLQRVMSIVLGSIAAMALLVGGIGIMNIMLASITERTREIGIRRALGAKRKHIVLQFLMETVLLSLGGGLLGIVFGVTLPALVEHFSKIPTIVTPMSIIIAFSVSVGIGIVFGLYPAYRAARMDPIEALRHE